MVARLQICGLASRARLPCAAVRHSSTKATANSPFTFPEPAWTVHSFLPETTSAVATADSISISPAQLSHFLRLAALPQPATAADQASMLETLTSQLRFVRAMQSVNTAGVTPLQALRDETPDAAAENTVGLEDPAVSEFLAREQRVGRMRRIVRAAMPESGRGGGTGQRPDGDVWDGNALGQASKTVEGFFVVQTSPVDGEKGGQT